MTEVTPTVYVIQRPYRDKDLSSAQRYGTIQFLIDDCRLQSSARPGVAQNVLDKGLAYFDPDKDYILHLGGDWAAVMIVGLMLRDKFPGRDIKILRWERERDLEGNRVEGLGFYTPATIRL